MTVKDLEKRIVGFYDSYSAKRVALAALITGLISIICTLLTYIIFDSAFAAAIAFVVSGLLAVNLSFFVIIPPYNELNSARDLLCEAIKDPSRIKAFSKKKVELLDEKGKVQVLKSREMGLWNDWVIPFMIESQLQGRSINKPKKSGRIITASERRYLEEKREEVTKIEEKIKKERQRLETDRTELEQRSKDLKKAEEVVIGRLTGIETAEAEIEQMRLSLNEKIQDGSATSHQDDIALKAKEAELKNKERELSILKERLQSDRQSLETHKTEFEKLKETVSQGSTPSSPEMTAEQQLLEREAALAARLEAVEAEAQALEERASFIEDAENSLLDRLSALSEREASIEQNEVNVGLRKDD